MFRGPKGYIAQICEVHLQYGNSTTKWPFTLFSSKFPSNIYSILFDSSTIDGNVIECVQSQYSCILTSQETIQF